MVNKYPKINYIGNKEKIAQWVVDQFPDTIRSVFDVFSGGGSIGYAAKQKGLKVISNDILKINYHIAKALLENNNEKLNKEDVDIIFNGEPLEGFIYSEYSNVCFFSEECKQLDLYRSNIELLSNDYKKSLALILLRRAMIRKMPYSRFNIKWNTILQLRNEEYSYEKYGRRRAYHNQTFREHFIKHLEEYNNSIFDNDQVNIAYNDDAFNLIDNISADLIYLDPPYTGTMNDYFSFYGMLDEYILGHKIKPFNNNFREKQSSVSLFETLFSKLGRFKYWYLSYNNNSYLTKDVLLSIIKKYSDNITVVERPHIYKITGKENKKTNIEYLFIIKNPDLL